MATGPEHYERAESLLAIVDNGDAADTMCTVDQLLSTAAVHATLALAAAVALGSGRADDHGMSPADDELWRRACSAGWSLPAPDPDPLAHVKVGDPNPFPDYTGSRCWQNPANPEATWACSRPVDHPGQHIAVAEDVVAVWPAEVPQ